MTAASDGASLRQLQEELDELAGRLGRQCATAGLMLTTAESCTGGAIARALTETAGSSDWFDRAFITYSNQAKIDMLGVPAAMIASYGAVSEPVARAMAAGAIRRSVAGLSVAVTGVAGPGGGSEEKPVGTVWFGWGRREADGQISLLSQRMKLPGDRSEVRLRTGLHGLLQIQEFLQRPDSVGESGLEWSAAEPVR